MYAEALRILHAALDHHHGDGTLWSILGSLLITRGRLKKGIDAFHRARALDPGNWATTQNLAQSLVSYANTLRFDGRLDEAIAALHEAIAIDGRGANARSLLMFCLLSRATTSSDELHASARASGAAHEAGIAPMLATVRPIGQPMRIGFLASKLVQSSVKYFLRPVFDHHDPASAYLYLYDEGGDAEEHARLVRGLAAWRDIKGLDNAAVARGVRADAIDVLVDLAGHGWYGRRLGVLAHRPAPVQATCIGYPGTLGMTSIGHRLTDRHLHPPGCGERFDEALAFLPHAFCYAAPDAAPAVAPLPAMVTGRITFASFNQLAKIDDATLRLWAAALAAMPTARLLLKRANLGDSSVVDALGARLMAHGIMADRVVFLGPRDSHVGHLAAYSEVDIALDTFPYNGTTTTCEALWMGIPVVTRVGDREVSRTGLSLLAAAGLERWAAVDDAAYVRIAVELASDISALARLRTELRGRLARSSLCDGLAYARHFIDALGRIRVDTPGAIC
jgi:predicted O-linked N-acetylglucosamine transferase (SPINDLY family)